MKQYTHTTIKGKPKNITISYSQLLLCATVQYKEQQLCYKQTNYTYIILFSEGYMRGASSRHFEQQINDTFQLKCHTDTDEVIMPDWQPQLEDESFSIFPRMKTQFECQQFYDDLADCSMSKHDSNQQMPQSYISTVSEIKEPAPIKQVNSSCNCKKSSCLKSYCDCFSSGRLCGEQCGCAGCFNTSGNWEWVHRSRQRKSKISEKKSRCRCKKTKCVKKYCECLSSGVECGELCGCVGCQNQGSIADGMGNMGNKSE